MEYEQHCLYEGKFSLYKHKTEERPVNLLGAYVEHKEGMMVAEFQTAYMALQAEEIPIRAELNSWEFIARTMETSYGYGLMPDLIPLDKRYPFLLPLSEPTLSYMLCAVYPKGEQLSYSAQVFLNALKEFTSNNI